MRGDRPHACRKIMISLVVYHTALTQPRVDEMVPPLSICD